MNMNKLINVGTRFIASTSAHLEPAPGRDKSRPYSCYLVSDCSTIESIIFTASLTAACTGSLNPICISV